MDRTSVVRRRRLLRHSKISTPSRKPFGAAELVPAGCFLWPPRLLGVGGGLVALVGGPVAHVRGSLAGVGEMVPVISGPVAFLGELLSLVGGSLARGQAFQSTGDPTFPTSPR
jgi:hypothetical protein